MKTRGFFSQMDRSAIWTIVFVAILFALSIAVTLVAPRYVDKSWTNPTCFYQVQMYEVADPNIYLSNTAISRKPLQCVYHLKQDFTLLAFQEFKNLLIVAPEELTPFVTFLEDSTLKLTSRLLLLRPPQKGVFDAVAAAQEREKRYQESWKKEHLEGKAKKLTPPQVTILELYDPQLTQAFALAETDGITEPWVDAHFTILDSTVKQSYHAYPGVVYVSNPQEYKVVKVQLGEVAMWDYSPDGNPVQTLQELRSTPLGFRSREELIRYGEHLFAIEGCWYCHTDQSRTLVQDCILNGSDVYPAPPSSANEYIYQNVTFPGTRRIGPDLSRVGGKRNSRYWHMAHFWAPRVQSPNSIMPRFTHFFDSDASLEPLTPYGVPNEKFEAIFQYMMTKGTRITPPTQAWWKGKDPLQTLDILEGKVKAEYQR